MPIRAVLGCGPGPDLPRMLMELHTGGLPASAPLHGRGWCPAGGREDVPRHPADGRGVHHRQIGHSPVTRPKGPCVVTRSLSGSEHPLSEHRMTSRQRVPRPVRHRSLRTRSVTVVGRDGGPCASLRSGSARTRRRSAAVHRRMSLDAAHTLHTRAAVRRPRAPSPTVSAWPPVVPRERTVPTGQRRAFARRRTARPAAG